MRQAALRPSFVRGLEGFVLIVAILYFAKAVLVPLALAALLTFVLTPIVLSMQRQGIPRIPAVLISVFLALLSFVLVGWVIGVQLQGLAKDLPEHRDEILRKIDTVRNAGGRGFSGLLDMFKEIDQLPQSARAAASAAIGRNGSAAKPPALEDSATGQKVAIVVPPAEKTSAFEQVSRFVIPVIEPLATTGLVIILVIFILINREDLRNRLIGLLGYSRMTGTTRVLVDAADRISRYLLSQLLVNAGFGLVFSIGLYFIGVQYAFLWGFLTGLLRFIPYVGGWIGAAFPLLLSFAVSPGWTHPAMVLGCFAALDLVTANVIEPLFFGHTTGVSPLALLIAAAFWTWVWGPIGLVLSTPLTVCLVVLGQHVPKFKFLELLLGDRPPLPPHVSYYQRLLARDSHEAEDVAMTARNDDPEGVYDKVLLPALVMARRERAQSGVDAEDESFITQTTDEILSRIAALPPKVNQSNGASEDPKEGAAAADGPGASEKQMEPRALVLGCPAHHQTEQLSLQMLGQLLKPDGINLEVLSTRMLPSEVEAQIEREKPALVFIAILPPGGLIQAQYLCKRLHKRFPGLKIVAGYWGTPRNFDKVLVRLRSAGAHYVTTSLAQSRTQILALIDPPTEPRARRDEPVETPRVGVDAVSAKAGARS